MALGDPPKTVIDFPKMPKLPKLPAGRAAADPAGAPGDRGWSSPASTPSIPRRSASSCASAKYTETTQPGLNFKLPLGIESVIKVPVQRQLKEEFGFRTQRAGVRSEFARTREALDESNLLTGDLNSAVVEWVIQYRIVEPYKFLFRVRNVQETLRDMSEAVMREVVGDRTVNEVLTVGRQEVADLVEQKLQELCDQYENGIKIDQVVLQDVNPPDRSSRRSTRSTRRSRSARS